VASPLEALGVPHVFTTRLGGVSAPPFDTLNLGRGVGDAPEAVAENRARAARALERDLEAHVEAAQVHGREVVVVSRAHRGQTLPGADGLITVDPAVMLAIHCADCVPILLSDFRRHVVAAVHTGWRGTAAGAVVAAVVAMTAVFGSDPGDITAAIGPSIGPCCYEVDAPVVERLRAWPWHTEVLAPSRRRGHWMLDLWEANRRQLVEAGVPTSAITTAGLCTAHHPALLFSHRRDGATGRMAALIAPAPVEPASKGL
jgi:YfiH family protein